MPRRAAFAHHCAVHVPTDVAGRRQGERPAHPVANLQLGVVRTSWVRAGLGAIGPMPVAHLCASLPARAPVAAPQPAPLPTKAVFPCGPAPGAPCPGPHPWRRGDFAAGGDVLSSLQLRRAEPPVWRHETLGAPPESPGGAELCTQLLSPRLPRNKATSHVRPGQRRGAAARCPPSRRPGQGAPGLRGEGDGTPSRSDLPLS